MKKEKIAGVALAGGRSRRMGRDKTLLAWPPGGKLPAGSPDAQRVPLWRHAMERLRRAADGVVLADGGRGLAPESVDDGPGRGPLAGILGAARHHPGHGLLVLAADLPLVPVELLRHLSTLAGQDPDAAWIVPRGQRGLEPLCALYRPALLPRLEERARSGVYSLHDLADERELPVRVVAGEELDRFGPPERVFANVNRPEDWARLG